MEEQDVPGNNSTPNSEGTEDMASHLSPIDEEPASPCSPLFDDEEPILVFNNWEKKSLFVNKETESGYSCQLCNGKKNTAVYCIDCSLQLCEQCQRQHSRIQGTSQHKIVPIKKVLEMEPRAHSNGNYKGDPITGCVSCHIGNCVLHSSQTLNIKPGRSISLDSLRSSYKAYQKSVESLKSDTMNYVDKLQTARKGTENIIVNQADKLHKDIDEMKNKLLKEIRNKVEIEENLLRKNIVELEGAQESMSETNNFLEAVIKCSNGMGLAELSKAITLRKKASNDLKNSTKLENLPTHVPSRRSEILHEPHSILKKDKQDFSAKSSRKTKFESKFSVGESLMAVCGTVDDTIAITTFSSKTCGIYSISGKRVRDISRNLIKPTTVISLSTGKILVADRGDDEHKQSYRMYYTDGESFPCNLTTLDLPWGMTETNDGDIVICHPETHKVCVFDKKGRSKLTLKNNLDGKNVFLNPRCVCVNGINGDIIVSDFERHSILFFDKNGEYKFKYGSLGKSSGHLHHPCGVCADSSGNVIVADSDNHRVHLVSIDGKFQRFILTQADGIDEPIAVCLTKDGLLVVGQWSGKVIVLNY